MFKNGQRPEECERNKPYSEIHSEPCSSYIIRRMRRQTLDLDRRGMDCGADAFS